MQACLISLNDVIDCLFVRLRNQALRLYPSAVNAAASELLLYVLWCQLVDAAFTSWMCVQSIDVFEVCLEFMQPSRNVLDSTFRVFGAAPPDLVGDFLFRVCIFMMVPSQQAVWLQGEDLTDEDLLRMAIEESMKDDKPPN